MSQDQPKPKCLTEPVMVNVRSIWPDPDGLVINYVITQGEYKGQVLKIKFDRPMKSDINKPLEEDEFKV